MTFEQAVVVAAPAAGLLALTLDYGRRLKWDPFLRSATLLGGATAAGVDVRALCVARTGLGMETEYVSFHPPRVAAVRMTRGPRVVRSFAGAWRFTASGPGRTRAAFRYARHGRRGLLTPVLAWAFACDTRRRLAALNALAESVKL